MKKVKTRAPSERVTAAAEAIRDLNLEELRQLFTLVPELRKVEPAITYFRRQAVEEASAADRSAEEELPAEVLKEAREQYRIAGTGGKEEEVFLENYTWGEFWALSDEEQERIWNAQFTMEKVATKAPSEQVTAAETIRDLSLGELGQLFTMASELHEVKPAIACFRRKAVEMRGGQSPSPDEPFIGGLSLREYVALSPQDQNAVWEKLFAEGEMDIEDFEERDVKPDAYVPAR